jgi:hypothetical protein
LRKLRVENHSSCSQEAHCWLETRKQITIPTGAKCWVPEGASRISSHGPDFGVEKVGLGSRHSLSKGTEAFRNLLQKYGNIFIAIL